MHHTYRNPPMPPDGTIYRRGHRVGVVTNGRFIDASPGRSHQIRCAQFVAVRAMLANVRIVGVWPTK